MKNMSINERHCVLYYVYSVAPHNCVWCNNMKIKNKWFSNGVLGIPLFRFVERITKKYKCIIFTSFFCSLHLIHTKTTSSTQYTIMSHQFKISKYFRQPSSEKSTAFSTFYFWITQRENKIRAENRNNKGWEHFQKNRIQQCS